MTSLEQNKALVRRVMESVNDGNLDALDDLLSPDFVLRNAADPSLPPGPEGMKRMERSWYAAFPDGKSIIQDQIAEGDEVVTRWVSHATHRGPIFGVAPTGKRIELTGIAIDRIANGKLVEHWDEVDIYGLLQQIGAVSAPGQSGSAPSKEQQMSPIAEIERAARAGADSVYAYVERTAESVGDGQDGQFRWRTLTYENEPRYDSSAGGGVAGIALFLADYHRLTGVERALELARGAGRWCSAPERLPDDESLALGRAGVGMALLRLAAAGDSPAAARAADLAAPLLARDPGPVTTLYGGAAGEGLFLLRLFEHTREDRHLSGALARAAWLDSVATRTGGDTYWTYQTDDEPWYGTGFGPGSAGIGYVLTLLYGVTHDARWARLVRDTAATLVRHAKTDHGGLNWAQTFGEEQVQRVQLCDDAPGIGRFFAAAHQALGDADLLATATAAAEATYAYGDVRGNASQCHGLAGNAELFVELFRVTREARWRERAHDFATQALRYRTPAPEGDVWQADDPGFTSPELLFGAGGTGHFFLRLWRPDDVPIALF